jgi:CheY-like chemotaxis protein/anti-sigma regulatory factor (Ser/Thr protein kinase)
MRPDLTDEDGDARRQQAVNESHRCFDMVQRINGEPPDHRDRANAPSANLVGAMAEYDVLIVADDEATRDDLGALLVLNGFSVEIAHDGPQALDRIRAHDVRILLLDVGLPATSRLDVLAGCAHGRRPAKIVVVTGSDTPEMVLGALRQHAYDLLPKPIDPARVVEVMRRALAASNPPPIQVLSARPEWVELLVPCTREAVDRIQSFLNPLEKDLPHDVRESVGLAFRELLMNGVEWGGRLNPAQTVRVACLRTRRMLMYRMADPGPGFRLEDLPHAAGSDASTAITHDQVREEKGLRPGGFGLMLIRAIADDLLFNERRNEVVFVKYLDEPGDRPLSEGRE